MTTETNPIALNIVPQLTTNEIVELRDNVDGLYHTYMEDEIAMSNSYADQVEKNSKRLTQRLDAVVAALSNMGADAPTYEQPTRELIGECLKLVAYTKDETYRFADVEESIQKVSALLDDVAAALGA